jgi:hypothetical protein
MPQPDWQRTLGHSSTAMTVHYTDEDLNCRRPFIEKLARGLLSATAQAGVQRGQTHLTLPTRYQNKIQADG